MKEDKKLNIFIRANDKTIPKNSKEFFEDESFEDYNPPKVIKTTVGGDFEVQTFEFTINVQQWAENLDISETQLRQQIGRMYRNTDNE